VAACPQNFVPNHESDCIVCNNFVDLLDLACVEECPRGPLREDNIHMVGPMGVGNAYVGDNTGLCVECTDAALPFADYEAAACVAACPAGTFPNHNWACKDCGTTTTRAYTDLVHKRCVDTCPSGSVPSSDGECTACSAGEYADHVNAACVSSCPGDQTVDDVTNLDCKIVPDSFTPPQMSAAEMRQRELVKYALQVESRAR